VRICLFYKKRVRDDSEKEEHVRERGPRCAESVFRELLLMR